MKLCLILGLFCATVSSLTIPNYHHGYEEHVIEHKKQHIPIIKHDFETHHEGYQYSYETGNGIHAQEVGHIKNKGDKKHETLVQKGTVTYHDEHGHPITLTYVADEHGFQAQGSHLPTPPPLPLELAKAYQEAQLQHQHAEYAAQGAVEEQQYAHYQ